MATGKKSFILYCDLIHEVDHLTDEEKGKLFQHLLEYVNDMNPVLEDRVLLGSWKHIQRQLKRDLLKYEDIKEKRSEAGKASAEKRKQATTNPTSVESVEQTPTNPTVNGTDTVTVNVNDTVTVNENKKVKEALPPSPVKLSDRIPDIETFVSFGLEKASANRLNVTETALRMKYEAWKVAGWVNGNGQEVKNWKASLLNTLKHIVETEKGKPKEFETQPEREAREFMEQLKKDTTNLILYGDVQPNNHDQQPANDSRVQRLSSGSTGHEADKTNPRLH
jgi:hypothetical protein